MGYFLFAAILLLTSSAAHATEDSLRRDSSNDLFELLEDLYATPEQAEEALDYFDVLSFEQDLSRQDLAALPGITASTTLRLSSSATLGWLRISEQLNYRQSLVLLGYLDRQPRYFWSSRSRVQFDPLANTEKGYNDGRILGSSYKIYNRALLSKYGFRAGLLQVKDAGERNLLDHWRGYLQLATRQKLVGKLTLDQAIMGDYALGFGSGLLFSNGGMVGKSNEVIDAVEPNSRNVQGYLSSSISTGFRGIATSLSLGDLRTSLFYSNRTYDARSDSGIITSLPLDGYHRTESEEAKIDVAKSSLIGGHLGYVIADTTFDLQLGITAYNEIFDEPVMTGGFAHNFEGRSLAMFSQHGHFTTDRISASYEVAASRYDSGNANAAAASLIYEHSRDLQFSLNGRYLPHDFVSRHGSTFGESTDDAQNERGIYLGVRYGPAKDLILSSYVDLSNTFVPPYQALNNFKAEEVLLLGEYEFGESTKLTSRTRWKRKSDEERSEGARLLGNREQINSRFEHEWWPDFDLRLRTRAEIVNVSYNDLLSGKNETGFLVSGNAKWNVFEEMSVDLRITWFNAPSYDSRLYVYENDLEGASGLTMLYGAGLRYSLMVRMELIEGIRLAGKYGITVYSKEREFGSGITERTGKTASKLGFQLDVQL